MRGLDQLWSGLGFGALAGIFRKARIRAADLFERTGDARPYGMVKDGAPLQGSGR